MSDPIELDMTETIPVDMAFLGHGAFQAMTADEKTLLVCAGHIANELNILNKFLVWSIRRSEGIDSLVSGMQALTIAKLTAGKILEAHLLLKKCFARTVADESNLPLNEETRSAIKEIRRYFQKTNLVYRVRNQLSFHYNFEVLQAAAQDILGIQGSVVVAGITSGNTYHVGAELAANKALLGVIGAKSDEASLDAFFAEVQHVEDLMIKFLDGAVHAILTKYVPDLANISIRESIKVSHSMDTFKVPFFTTQNPAE